MTFELMPMEPSDIYKFKKDIQEAFQKGFEDVYGNKYKQRINYKYLDNQNKYQFFSNQPKRRK